MLPAPSTDENCQGLDTEFTKFFTQIDDDKVSPLESYNTIPHPLHPLWMLHDCFDNRDYLIASTEAVSMNGRWICNCARKTEPGQTVHAQIVQVHSARYMAYKARVDAGQSPPPGTDVTPSSELLSKGFCVFKNWKQPVNAGQVDCAETEPLIKGGIGSWKSAAARVIATFKRSVSVNKGGSRQHSDDQWLTPEKAAWIEIFAVAEITQRVKPFKLLGVSAIDYGLALPNKIYRACAPAGALLGTISVSYAFADMAQLKP